MTTHRLTLNLGLLLTFIGGSLAGCSGGGAPPAPAEGQPQAAVPATNQQASPPTQAAAPRTEPVDPNRKETKWLGDVPYDVFYEQPLTIAADTSRVGTGAVPAIPSPGATASAPGGAMATPAPAANNTPAATPATASASSSDAAGNVDWKEILPMETLVEEVKLLRGKLTGNLSTLATFNQNTKSISVDGAILSAMAAIVTVHPDPVSWKDNAHIVRDLGYEVSMKAEGTGRTPFQATLEPFEKAMIVVDGGTPPQIDSEPVVPFADVVYRSEAMKRIEVSFSGLKSNINTEARMKEDPVGVERELRVITALAAMIGTEDYDSAEEAKYQEYVKTFISGGLSGVDAIKIGNFDGFQAALNQIQKTCAECHQQYLGADSAF